MEKKCLQRCKKIRPNVVKHTAWDGKRRRKYIARLLRFFTAFLARSCPLPKPFVSEKMGGTHIFLGRPKMGGRNLCRWKRKKMGGKGKPIFNVLTKTVWEKSIWNCKIVAPPGDWKKRDQRSPKLQTQWKKRQKSFSFFVIWVSIFLSIPRVVFTLHLCQEEEKKKGKACCPFFWRER